jgi:hypothetical protein
MKPNSVTRVGKTFFCSVVSNLKTESTLFKFANINPFYEYRSVSRERVDFLSRLRKCLSRKYYGDFLHW